MENNNMVELTKFCKLRQKKIEVKLDNKLVECDKYSTVLKCALNNGFKIPTLCNNDLCEKENGCMVCAVYDKNTQQFIASCSVKIYNGMDLEIDTERVYNFRKKIIELLLSEHIGDCYAPCQRVCPYNFNIPTFLEKLNSKKFNEASEMVNNAAMNCEECGYKCEKACRRNLIDKPVAIRKLINKYFNEKLQKKPLPKKMKTQEYSHKFGKINLETLEILKSRTNDINGCLQCHCKKVNNCKLKKIAEEYNAKQSSFKSENKIIFDKFIGKNIIFEPGKCIRCGICANILGKQNIDSLSMQFRGWETIPWTPIGVDWNDSLNIGRKIAEECPTGALYFEK